MSSIFPSPLRSKTALVGVLGSTTSSRERAERDSHAAGERSTSKRATCVSIVLVEHSYVLLAPMAYADQRSSKTKRRCSLHIQSQVPSHVIQACTSTRKVRRRPLVSSQLSHPTLPCAFGDIVEVLSQSQAVFCTYAKRPTLIKPESVGLNLGPTFCGCNPTGAI